MTARIYNVSNGVQDALIRATSRSQAIRYVAEATYTCRVATQDDIVQALTTGHEIADATTSRSEPVDTATEN